MWDWLKKATKKDADRKEENTMNEHLNHDSRQGDSSNDELEMMFNRLVLSCTSIRSELRKLGRELDSANYDLKKSKCIIDNRMSKCQKEISEYQDMYAVAKNEVERYKNKVQARKIMEVILPTLSKIKNDIFDFDDIDKLRERVNTWYEVLFEDLSLVGVTISEHQRGQDIDPDEKLYIDDARMETTDPSLDGKVARSRKMGCVIRGEEEYPILETVIMYGFKEPEPINSQGDEGAVLDTADTNNEPSENSNDMTYDNSIPSEDAVNESLEENREEVECEQDPTMEEIEEQDIPEAILSYDGVKLSCPLELRGEGGSITLVSPDEYIELGPEKYLCFSQGFGKDNLKIYLGKRCISDIFSLDPEENMLSCKIVCDTESNSMSLQINKLKGSKVTGKLVDHKIIFINL